MPRPPISPLSSGLPPRESTCVEIGMPSTTQSGWPPPWNEDSPRITIRDEAPGCPLELVTCTPAV